ncbi:MAG: hypothetical protein CFH01_00487 [Alphaproteobacteria bacterium MarineAlpha2_Bin1]|nr:MAG: hypothetical protein CFH01_00487 [Alphaproteobacteria bacterium MarineAlpha2_Bin1]|tara:strand:- start:27 stop:329 length:303 start_codon:yes stop_codon:yes gene_type:complete
MNRRFYIVFGIILIVLVASLFQLKHQVVKLEKNLVTNQSLIQKEKESIKVLKAEWSYLTNPSRIEILSENFLNLRILTLKQIGDIEKIPFFIEKKRDKNK